MSKKELAKNERIIKYDDMEYIQVLLPVKQGIILRNKWTNKDGSVNELKMFEEVLKNMFDRPYSLDDFISNHEVDSIVADAINNQYTKGK